MANLEIVDKGDMFWHGLPDQVGQRLSFKSREEKFAPFPNLPIRGEMPEGQRGNFADVANTPSVAEEATSPPKW
jgi:hypothetical protein